MTRGREPGLSAGFGWHGLHFRLPDEWELHSYGGDFACGNARLDDSRRIRLQVWWRAAPDRVHSVETLLAHYRKHFAKRDAARAVFEILPSSFLPKRFRRGKAIVAFRREGAHPVYGAIWYGSSSKRVILTEVYAEEGDTEGAQPRGVLGSARDGDRGGTHLWSVYGFAFHMPATYNLVKPELNAGRLRFLFRDGASWASVGRWSMAGRLLKDLPLERWPAEVLKLDRTTAAARLADAPVPAQAGPGIRFDATLPRPGLLGRLRRPEALHGQIWHDGAEDKVCAVIVLGNMDALARIVGSVRAGRSAKHGGPMPCDPEPGA